MARILRSRPALLWLALIAVFAVVAASCGDDGETGGEQAAEPAAADQPAPEPAPDEGDDMEPAAPDEGEEMDEPEPAASEEPAPDEAEPEPAPDEGEEMDEPEPAAPEEPFQVAYLSASSANTWLLASRLEMQAVAAANNIEITEFDAQFDPGLQTTQFQDAIASGAYDGVILVAIAGIASAPDIESAVAAGMEVVILNQVVGEDYTTSEP